MTTPIHTALLESAIDAIERAERMRRQFFRLAGQQSRTPVWEPPIEVFEHEGQLAIVVALPGVPPDLVTLTFEGDMLIVAAERKLPQRFAVGAVHCMEIPYGHFERHIRLPTGRFRLVQRSAEHGCLLLELERLG
ncbi:Hsp20/alpha crystallin family protein [Paraburkholderia sp. C35]|uniref:Hsp20/alpha crystallin family protein n=1 Tax=Paraburkholderia sp. C35 TaxID=2126993 RepID=UPI000D688D3E|nr:Hsp20/alpha crystallin family protein [Paraburkholderia sp. C35]